MWNFIKKPHQKEFDKAPRDPISGSAIVGWIASSLGVSTLAATAIYVVGTTAVAFAVNYLLRPKQPETQTGTVTNFRAPTAPQEIIYGRVRKGGPITYVGTSGTKNKFLHIFISMAGHEVSAIGQVYLNDKTVSLDGTGFVTDSEWKDADGNAKVLVKKFLGTSSQNVGSTMRAYGANVPSNFYGKGIAGLYVRFAYDADVFAGGIPSVSAIIAGKKVYDPRTDTTVYSNNPALCIRDYLIQEYGLNTPSTTIDDTSFSVAANDCEDSITLVTGGTENRYEINGVISTGNSVGSNLGLMTASMAGNLFYSEGKFQLIAGVWSASVKTLTLDDLRSPISLATKTARRDNFNSVTGTFIDANQDWIEVDYPKIKSSTFLIQDGSYENPVDLPLPLTTSSSMAQRLAKQLLYRAREQISFTADFGLNAFDLNVGDTISLTIDKYGWSSKTFEVINWKVSNSSDSGEIIVTMTLRETSQESFQWNIEEVDLEANNTTLLQTYDAPAVGLALSAELRAVNQEAIGVISVEVQSDNDLTDVFEVQYKKSSDTSWISLGRSDVRTFEIKFTEDSDFDVRARAITALGVRGEWATTTGFSARPFSALPEDVSGLSINISGSTATLNWAPVGDLDLSHYEVRFSGSTTAATWPNSVVVVEKVARPATTVNVPVQQGTYLIKAVDKLGYKSNAAATSVVLTNLNDILNLNVVESYVQNPTYTGTKTDTVEVDGYLALDSALLFDDQQSTVENLLLESGDFLVTEGGDNLVILDQFFDEVLGMFDSGGSGTGSGVSLIGYYEFPTVLDLGAKYPCFIQKQISIQQLDYINTFDSATTDFDDRQGDFDGDPSQYDSSTVKLQISTTDDDTSGTPTWSSWNDLIAGTYLARGFKFRAVLTTDQPFISPRVDELSVTVDMEDRVESKEDISFTGTSDIVFTNAFYSTSSPAIGVALTGLGTGDYYEITSKDNTGFTITVKDSTGTQLATSTQLDYVAKGYGKEVA